MMRMLLLALCLLALPAAAAPTEADAAVKVLRAKGIVQGYPNGDYHGNRAMTRYEVSQMVDRLQRYLESQTQDLAPRSELNSLKASGEALQKSLEDLGGRTGNAEHSLDNETQRVDDVR